MKLSDAPFSCKCFMEAMHDHPTIYVCASLLRDSHQNAALTHKSTFQVGHAPFVPGCRMLSFARKLISYAKQVS